MHRIKYAIIGGDMRNVYLAELLKKDYQYVEIYGFEKCERLGQVKMRHWTSFLMEPE